MEELYMQLKTLERFIDQTVEVEWSDYQTIGRLTDVEEDSIILDSEAGLERIPISEIKSINEK